MNSVHPTIANLLLTVFVIVSTIGFYGCGGGQDSAQNTAVPKQDAPPNDKVVLDKVENDFVETVAKPPETQILGVLLGRPINSYRMLKKPDTGEDVIDPTMFQQPGDMGGFKWSYYADVDSEGTVYRITCKTDGNNYGSSNPRNDPEALNEAIMTVYPLENVSQLKLSRVEEVGFRTEFRTKAKDGYIISVDSERYPTSGYYETTISIFHGDTSSRELDKARQKKQEQILKKNEGF